MTRTPDVVLDDLRGVRREIARGSDFLFDAEVKAENAELAARKAAARLAAEEELTAAVVARAEYNRIKAKIKALELEQTSLQTELKYMVGEGA